VSGWLYALIAYFILESIGVIMFAGKRVYYSWPLVTLSVIINLGWVIIAAELMGHLK
jgi:hypothetical protein